MVLSANFISKSLLVYKSALLFAVPFLYLFHQYYCLLSLIIHYNQLIINDNEEATK